MVDIARTFKGGPKMLLAPYHNLFFLKKKKKNELMRTLNDYIDQN